MRILSRSLIGETNLLLNRPNQDAYTIENSEGKTSICICDGAGFSDHSAIAAKEVSQIVAKLMIKCYDEWYPDKVRKYISKCILLP